MTNTTSIRHIFATDCTDFLRLAINLYGFCGKEWNPSGGLYDFGARYYAPSSASGSRWTAQDPLASSYPGISAEA